MSDTPRTDEVYFAVYAEAGQAQEAMYEHACQLERENDQVRDAVTIWQKLADERKEQIAAQSERLSLLSESGFAKIGALHRTKDGVVHYLQGVQELPIELHATLDVYMKNAAPQAPGSGDAPASHKSPKGLEVSPAVAAPSEENIVQVLPLTPQPPTITTATPANGTTYKIPGPWAPQPSAQSAAREKDAPYVRAAFINALAEEGTKAEAIQWLQKTWNELCQAESEVRRLRADMERAMHNHAADLTEAGARSSGGAPAGWKLVPVEATPDMVQAAEDRHVEGAAYVAETSVQFALWRQVWIAMLAAAPDYTLPHGGATNGEKR